MEFIKNLALWIYRRPGVHQAPGVSRHIVLNSFAVAVVFAAIILFWSKFQDSQHRPVLEIEASRWTALIGESDENCWEPDKKNLCPANPDNPELWNSGLHRRDPDYYRILESDRKKPFWLGLKVSAGELSKVRSRGATRLMLGLLYTRYDVWVDGVRVDTGDYMDNDLPIALDITGERLASEKPLFIAISAVRDGKVRTVDSDWFVPTMGFYSSAASDQQMRWVAFSGDSCYYVIFAVFFLFGLIFRFAATADENKVEFPAASVFSFVLAFSQFVLADSTFRFLSAGLYYPLLNATLLAEFFAAIAFGLAVSRSRAGLLRLTNILVPLAALLGFIATELLNDGGALTQKIVNYVSPLGFFASGLFCLLQYFLLRTSSVKPSARRRVLLGTLGVMLLGISFSFIAETAQAEAVETHWVRVLLVLPLYILTTSLAATVRQNFKMAETTPVSAFHKLSPLPDAVNGVVINLDLKSSEKLFRAGAQEDVGGTLVSTILSQIWNRFSDSGATVIQSSGDDLLLIYEESKLASDPLLWLKTLRTVHEELQLIATQLADSHAELATLKSLEFRAAASRGAVRPLWRQIGSGRVPGWVEAGGKNVFVDTARLLQIEKQWSKEQKKASVLIADETLEIEMKDVPHQNIEGEGKHGRVYRGAVVMIGP